jgi:hypothetical protein
MKPILKIVGHNAVLSLQDAVLTYERGRFLSAMAPHRCLLNAC